MNLTITKKLFWGMSGLIMMFVLLSQFFNSRFLEDYYVSEIKKQLTNIYASINDIYQGDAEEISLQLEKLERTTGIHIIIFNSNFEPIYRLQRIPEEHFEDQEYDEQYHQRSSDDNPFIPSPNRNLQNPDPSPPGIKQGFEKNLLQLNQKEVKEGKMVFNISKDPRIQTNFISLLTSLNNGDYLILSTPFASISESVRIANRFFLFTGLLVFVLGSIVIFIFSKKLTMPILKLNDIAQRMAKLDFSQKYQVESNDEVGQLGESINSLSTQLHIAISELTAANHKLLEDIERERKIDEMRREFISNVSHELKTPISLIQGYAEGLRENVNEDEENKNFYCEVIADEANKMGKLVRELLDLAQIEAGTFKLEKSNFDISRLIANIVEKYKPILLEKKIDCSLQEEPEFAVSADRFRTEQIVFNYLNNAINHVNDQKKITISIQKINSKARVTVYNSGCPIAPESLDKVWESFYKEDKARTRAYGGTGLGLSIVKAIQEIDNNKYGVLNKNAGVEFWFELDIAG
ncbi:histidine kinase [Desulfofarcimen acetoxidans DSM 771]|uniref:histidine kinase n=1 Tax=Desulfofarcimen acetoxidans (strain ATCC 49208 / DSM 771 / KCTC 5769 / VKM B-1644 / 5575) TaxID=485916 RepID=C8W2I6_DESAS|nr:HAMP domain-containing sensor histidine kinase [Desulfofarcimen acetoxidans]ACV63670.1 histidine kinase [Desulfofarcimen acetoxidans DSM 771]